MEEKLRGPEEYTHGGVKKTKFEPKVPARRSKKLPAATKREPGEADEGNQALPRELQRLLEGDGQRNQTSRRAGEVAFGFSTGPRSQSAPSGAAGRRRVGGGEENGATRSFAQADVAEKGDSRRGLEDFDHEKYYPVTLPLRKPGDASRIVDGCEEEEEGEGGAEAARELGLSEDEDMVLFFQFPKGLPLRVDGEEIRAARLEELRKGGGGGQGMGKVLVYESGVVKFKVGDVVLDALPGTECAFTQEVAAVNVASKQCAFVGGVHKRVVLTPDFTTLLRESPNPKP